MRVKKLNVNRRHKPGEDEAVIGVAAGEDSEQRRWISPTKSLREEAGCGSSSRSSSPTDVQQPQHLGTHSPVQYQTNNYNNDDSLKLFVGGVSGTGGELLNVAPSAVDIDMHGDKMDAETSIRTVMINRIVEMLQAMKPHAPEKVLAALPKLAQHMEKTLFKLAKNKAEYSDPTTLRLRIVQIQENNAKRLLAQQQQTPEQKRSGNKAVITLKSLTEEQACSIFHHLQSWRQKLVNTYGVAPWDILPNSTLARVALYMPSTNPELVVCGVENDKLMRFGSSLLQELQHLRSKLVNDDRDKATQGHKSTLGKRGSSESLASGNNTHKKWKTGKVARLVPTGSSVSSSSLVMSPTSVFSSVDSLPTLLPTVSLMPGNVLTSTTSTSNSKTTMTSQSPSSLDAPSPPVQPSEQSFLTRLQSQQHQEPGSRSIQENHMHLLVEGAGQLSKQSSTKSFELYEKEVQSLRWMLHQSQEENSRLEQEIQQLRLELHRNQQKR